MTKKNLNKSKSDKDKIYLSYNQITKEYDVQILSDDEYNNLSKQQRKEVKHIVLTYKSKHPPKPDLPPAWALAMEERIIVTIKQYVDKKIHNLAIKNNLKE